MSDFDGLVISGKLMMPIFGWIGFCGVWSSDRKTTASRKRALRMVLLMAGHFSIKIPVKPNMFSVNRDNQVVDEVA
jgi:hypothetical protein